MHQSLFRAPSHSFAFDLDSFMQTPLRPCELGTAADPVQMGKLGHGDVG